MEPQELLKLLGRPALVDGNGDPVPVGDDWDLLPHLSSEYMSGSYMHLLYGLARFQRPQPVIVEVGVWKGLTASLFAQAAKLTNGHAWGIDIGEYADEAQARVKRLGLNAWWTYIQGDSAEIGKLWDRRIDFLYLDGDHEYPGVTRDIEAWTPHVRIGGYVACHDYQSKTGVKQGVDEFLDGNAAWQGLPLTWEHGLMLLRHRGVAE